MLYKITGGTVSLGGTVILDHVDFAVRGQEKIAIVGSNGAGKTTLLRLIAGELELDRDDKRFEPGIWMARDTTIGMLGQNVFDEESLFLTVEELMERLCPAKDPFARERFEYEQEYQRMFTGMGFAKEDQYKKICEFSGGQQTRIALIGLLLQKPDLLLLDEPTNHLDLAMTGWLENYLSEYPKAVVMVSHDRFFLDQTADTIWELSEGKLTRYAGNYTDYRKQREKKRQEQEKKYKAQQQEIERLNQLIEKFKHKPKKASMARAKKKQIERMERISPPSRETAHCFTERIVPAQMGAKRVLETDKLQIGYTVPLKEITMQIRRGQKIGILGANGTGKTTFLKTIAGRIPPLSGSVQTGLGIQMGYFDQMTGRLVSDQRVYEYFHEQFPKLTIGEVKKKLSQFLFFGEDSGKKVSDLSGGEKNRLVLARMLEEGPNFLVLDEPTNHMDIGAMETMESAFQAYAGTILFVSHDRYFIREVATALLIFEEDRVVYYPFGYEHYRNYLRKKEQREQAGPGVVETENAMLVEELSQVPEKKRMQSARFSTEQSFADWQLQLAMEQLQQKKIAWGAHYEKREEEQYWFSEEYRSGWQQKEEELCRQYEEESLRWYEKWMEYEDAFRNYKDN